MRRVTQSLHHAPACRHAPGRGVATAPCDRPASPDPAPKTTMKES